MVTASAALAGGHTDKVPEAVEADWQQIISLPAREAVGAWMALSPEQRAEMIHYSRADERFIILQDFETVLEVDGLKPSKSQATGQ